MSGIPYNRLQTVELTIETDNGETVFIETLHYAFVVSCRDCKHYKPYRTYKHGIMNRCHDEHGHTHKRDESDFCSRGERREQ